MRELKYMYKETKNFKIKENKIPLAGTHFFGHFFHIINL